MPKRIFDVFFSVVGLILFTPLFLIIAVLIKFLMPGPVFFIQIRIGKNGEPFKMYKFRTMKVAQGKEIGSFDAGDNSRITALGKLLRKTKFDELPQLLNVMFGEMSIVGPRPEVEKWTKVYPEKWHKVHTVRPGITDPASIVFRNEEEILAASKSPLVTYQYEILPKKLDLYIGYIEKKSIWIDIKIIFKTFKAIFT